MGRYVQVDAVAEGTSRQPTPSYGNIGIVGRGIGSGFTVDQAYSIRDPNDAKVLFDSTSALYNSILTAFTNGASRVFAVPAAVTAATQETFSGTGSQTEFVLAAIPAPPMDGVTVDAAAQVEGTDFIVDYGNKTLIFTEAPALGTDNIEVDYSSHTATQVEDALVALEQLDVQFVFGAMLFDSALLSEIDSHIDAMASTAFPRRGVYQLAKGETSTTLATTLVGERNILGAHQTYDDFAAAMSGAMAGYKPWESLTKKPIIITQTERFTQTEIDAFDAAQIVHAFPLTGSQIVFSTGVCLDSTGNFYWIDIGRVLDYFRVFLEAAAQSAPIIGVIRITRAGMRELDNYLAGLLNPYVRSGVLQAFEINNRARTLLEIVDPDASEIAEIQALQSSRRLEDPYHTTIKLFYAGSPDFLEIELVITTGAV